MRFIDFLKNFIGNDEEQFVTDESDPKVFIINLDKKGNKERTSISLEDKKEMFVALAKAKRAGEILDKVQQNGIKVTPADRSDLEQDSTVKNVKNRVGPSGRYNTEIKFERPEGGKDFEQK